MGWVTDLSWLPDASVDFALASNVFEHIANEDLTTLLEQLRRKLSQTGRLCLIQPNHRYYEQDDVDSDAACHQGHGRKVIHQETLRGRRVRT